MYISLHLDIRCNVNAPQHSTFEAFYKKGKKDECRGFGSSMQEAARTLYECMDREELIDIVMAHTFDVATMLVDDGTRATSDFQLDEARLSDGRVKET